MGRQDLTVFLIVSFILWALVWYSLLLKRDPLPPYYEVKVEDKRKQVNPEDRPFFHEELTTGLWTLDDGKYVTSYGWEPDPVYKPYRETYSGRANIPSKHVMETITPEQAEDERIIRELRLKGLTYDQIRLAVPEAAWQEKGARPVNPGRASLR